VHRGPLRIAANLGDVTVVVPAAEVSAGSGVLIASDAPVSVTPGSVTLPPASLVVVDVAKSVD
jgi:hypothetical protein